MEYTNYRNYIRDQRDYLNYLKTKLARAEETERSRKKLEEDKSELMGRIEEVKSYKQNAMIINKVAMKEYMSYRKRRIEFLDSKITDNVERIFPQDGFVSKIEYDTSYGKENAYVTLIDRNGFKMIPKYANGGLLKELIGFTSAVSLLDCLGSNTFFFDEAFGMSSIDNKEELGKLVSEQSNKGVQMFLISQSPELYDNINCRCIYLERDKETNITSITNITDFKVTE